MRGLGITPKQRRYAYHVMNTSETKKEAMLKAGYSENMSMQPSRVENSTGFKLAMAKQAFEAGNIASGLMNEIQARGYKDYDNKTMFQALDIISKAFERFVPKETKQNDEVIHAFQNIIDITPLETHAEQAEHTPIFKDETTIPLDTQEDVLDSNSIT
jgi:phage terminase small subunit